jgi:D-psicose/D-tagatose/L-ribulose 3-epimerase
LPALREHGLQALEIPMFEPELLPTAAIRRSFTQHDMACTVCAILPPGINPISPEALTRRQAHEYLRRCVHTAAELGASLLGGPLFAPIGYLPDHRPTADESSWAVEAFQQLGDLLDSYSMTLSIEPVNRAETFFLRTGAEAEALCKVIDHPRVGITIDTFHANIEEKDIALAVRKIGPYLKHLHLSENDRGLLGSGHVDFPAILKAARAVDYSGYLMIEGFGFSAEELHGPGVLWAAQAVSPEAIAFEGARYLQALLQQG